MLGLFQLNASKHFRLQKGSTEKKGITLKRNEKITLTQVTVIPRVRLSPEGLAVTDGVSILKVWALGKTNGKN